MVGQTYFLEVVKKAPIRIYDLSRELENGDEYYLPR